MKSQTLGFFVAAWFALLIFVTIFCAGCSLHRGAKSPESEARTASASLITSGDAKTPATVARKSVRVYVPIPSGSIIYPVGRDGLGYILGTDSAIETETTEETLTGAGSFTPAAPPSAFEESIAWGIKGAWIAAVALALLAVLLFARGHAKAGFCAVAGAFGVPAGAIFLGSWWGMLICAVSVTAAGALFAAWHFMRWRREKAAKTGLAAFQDGGADASR